MSVLSNLVPGQVFHFFEEICSIPHGSYHEEQLSDYCVQFAKDHGFDYRQDQKGNVIIFRPASKGLESAETIIIQGHLDMVCEKEADCKIDFATDGLELEVQGDYISAKGTTLGADDGIAIAYALALLDDKALRLPALEAVFTVGEEVGMIGAEAIDLSDLKGRKLLNIDSEEEGIFTVGCAGGVTVGCHFPVQRKSFRGVPAHISIEGLAGGHSGMDIGKGRANANVLAGRLLLFLLERELEFGLLCVCGGGKDNVITKSAQLEIVVQDYEKLTGLIQIYAQTIHHEYHVTEPRLKIDCTLGKIEDLCQQAERQTADYDVIVGENLWQLAAFYNALPNGVQAMSQEIKGLVETSLNLGTVQTTDTEVFFEFLVRSSVNSAKEYLRTKLAHLTQSFGGTVQIAGDYPAWEYCAKSSLCEVMVEIYHRMFGETPKVEVIHAGVECGTLADKIAGLDCVSFGPNIYDIHTYDERLSISSVQRTWKFLLEVIARLTQV